jgi:SPP1 family predicted phage head-tail adaptor
MKSGELRHRVVLERATTSRLPSGGTRDTWSPYATVWAAVEPIQGREFFAAQQLNAEATHRIRIRYRVGVSPKDRVTFEGRIFEIKAPPINVDEKSRELHLMCVEVVS